LWTHSHGSRVDTCAGGKLVGLSIVMPASIAVLSEKVK